MLGALAGCGERVEPAAVTCDRTITPAQTVQSLADALEPGQTGCLRAGTYTAADGADAVLVIARGGLPNARVTLRSYPGERATLKGLVKINPGGDGVTLTDLDIVGTGDRVSIEIYGRGAVISNSVITNRRRGRSCLILGGYGRQRALAPTIFSNTFRDCGNPAHGNKDHAIYAQNVRGGAIENNVFVNPAAYAIQFYPDAHELRFGHNVLVAGDSVRGGIVFGGDGRFASTDNVVEHNVLYGAATSGIEYYWGGDVGSGNVARDNCVFRARDGAVSEQVGFRAERTVVADPHFTDPAKGDYALGKGPCRDAMRR